MFQHEGTTLRPLVQHGTHFFKENFRCTDHFPILVCCSKILKLSRQHNCTGPPSLTRLHILTSWLHNANPTFHFFQIHKWMQKSYISLSYSLWALWSKSHLKECYWVRPVLPVFKASQCLPLQHYLLCGTQGVYDRWQCTHCLHICFSSNVLLTQF